MICIVSKLYNIADRLEEPFADDIDKIAVKILEAYKPRVKRQRRARGITRTRRRQYYKRRKMKIKRKQKLYRRRNRVHLERRKRLRHYKRFG